MLALLSLLIRVQKLIRRSSDSHTRLTREVSNPIPPCVTSTQNHELGPVRYIASSSPTLAYPKEVHLSLIWLTAFLYVRTEFPVKFFILRPFL